MEDTIVDDITAALNKHINASPPEDMEMPHILHWVISFSVEDVAQDKFIHLRTAYPTNQPRYVTTGLMAEAGDMFYQYGDDHEVD